MDEKVKVVILLVVSAALCCADTITTPTVYTNQNSGFADNQSAFGVDNYDGYHDYTPPNIAPIPPIPPTVCQFDCWTPPITPIPPVPATVTPEPSYLWAMLFIGGWLLIRKLRRREA